MWLILGIPGTFELDFVTVAEPYWAFPEHGIRELQSATRCQALSMHQKSSLALEFISTTYRWDN